MFELREPIDQQLEPWREFAAFPRERLTKPLADLIADRAAMHVVDAYICGDHFRHDEARQDPASVQ